MQCRQRWSLPKPDELVVDDRGQEYREQDYFRRRGFRHRFVGTFGSTEASSSKADSIARRGGDIWHSQPYTCIPASLCYRDRRFEGGTGGHDGFSTRQVRSRHHKSTSDYEP